MRHARTRGKCSRYSGAEQKRMTNALTNLPLSEAAVIADCGAPVADLPAEVRMTDRRLLRPDSPAQMRLVFGRRAPPFVASLKKSKDRFHVLSTHHTRSSFLLFALCILLMTVLSTDSGRCYLRLSGACSSRSQQLFPSAFCPPVPGPVHSVVEAAAGGRTMRFFDQ